MIEEAGIRERYAGLGPHLGERGRRLFAAVEARATGHGGVAGDRDRAEHDRARPGGAAGGRKAVVAQDARLLPDLLALVEPSAPGDPESALRWTCKSLRRLADELRRLGHRIGHTVVGELLKQQRFSLQANRKVLKGSDHADRDAQFGYINQLEHLAG